MNETESVNPFIIIHLSKSVVFFSHKNLRLTFKHILLKSPQPDKIMLSYAVFIFNDFSA